MSEDRGEDPDAKTRWVLDYELLKSAPDKGWGQDLMTGKEVEVNIYETELPMFNPVGATYHASLWHRGYPLQLISKRYYQSKMRKGVYVDMQADLGW